MNEETLTAARVAASAIEAKGGLDLILLDQSGLLVITDLFLIASGTSNRHIQSLIEEAEARVKAELGRKPLRREGVREGKWVLLDYGDFVIHVFDAETRAYYDLERLWADAPRVVVEESAPAEA